jgi:ABC-type phosphate transport system substrate-binding protein
MVLAFGLALARGSDGGPPAEGRYWVIVHPDNPTVTMRRDEVSKIFLKQLTRWSDGRAAVPVDLVVAAPARGAFSRDVHRRPVELIKKYWQQMVFSGKSAPPPEVATESDVLSMVSADPGAIGYVSDEAILKGVKIVDIVAPPHADSGQGAATAR